jgi:hypothetical protein
MKLFPKYNLYLHMLVRSTIHEFNICSHQTWTGLSRLAKHRQVGALSRGSALSWKSAQILNLRVATPSCCLLLCPLQSCTSADCGSGNMQRWCWCWTGHTCRQQGVKGGRGVPIGSDVPKMTRFQNPSYWSSSR